jgi:peptidoglycan hydrolase-like amidase
MMMRMTSRIVAAAALAASFAVMSVSAQAQQAQNVRVRGTVEKLDGNLLTVKSRDGSELKLKLKDNATVRGVVKASLADVKSGSNVAITSRPRPDGTLQAVELRIFPPGPFNTFHRDWDLMPNSFMTNGNLETSIAGVDGQVLTVQYKAGDKTVEMKIVVTPQTIIATTVAASKADLKPGLHVFVAGAPKLPDGSLDVGNIQVEKEIPPPQ